MNNQSNNAFISKPMLALRLIAIIVLSCGLALIAEELYRELFTPTYAVFHKIIWLLVIVYLLLLSLSRFVVNPMMKEMVLLRESEEHLQQSELRNRIIIEAFPDNILHVNEEGIVLDFKPAKKSIISFAVGKNACESLPPDVIADFFRCMNAALKDGAPQRSDFAFGKDSEVSHHIFTFVKAAETELMIFIRDITKRKTYEARLEHVSTHDALTGLYNRAYYEAEIDRLATSRRYPVSIIIIDLDGLKIVNDTYGHSAGDKMICKAADILKKSFRAEDLVARTGGDEFTVLLPEIGVNGIEASIERIQRYLEEANSLNDGFEVKMSVGFALAEAKEKLLGALKLADLRMYENKSSRKSASQS
jgi:diguanylate cyclase (GGDEF)-like protein